MPKISEIDLGSALLSTFILIGFIATGFVVIRLTIIGVNYIKENFLQKEEAVELDKKPKPKNKGFWSRLIDYKSKNISPKRAIKH